MKPYPTYKNPGLPWVERIPVGWDALPNIALFDERIERGFSAAELLSVTQDRGIIKQSELEEKKDSSNEDKSAYKRVRVGDIAYNKMRMWQGAVGHSPFEGIVSPAYIVLKPKRRINPRYFHYLFRTPAYTRESYRNSYGICDDQLSLRFFNFKRMQSIIPPVEEQHAIVSFLEAKEQEIQTFIANKRRMIELLKEQTTVLINRAVARGLNPDAPLKPSCIPWLGDIPQAWQPMRFKFFVGRIEQGWSPQCENEPATEDKWGVLKVGCVNGNQFDGSENKTLPNNLDPIPELEIKPGDILVSRANSRELVGSAGLVENTRPKLLLCDKLFRVRAKPSRAVPKFLVLALRSRAGRLQIEADATGASSSMQNIGQGTLSNLWLAAPSLEEQKEIVSFAESERKRTAALIATAEREIALMEEYRTALIAAAVTGKIDARQASVEVVSAPRPNRHFARALLSAEIVHQLHIEPTFGRIKHQKILHLCEFIGGIEEIQGEYHREAAGPLDNKLIYSVETELKKQKWFEEYRREQFGHGYRPLAKAGGHRTYVERYWKDKLPIIERLIKLMRTWDTERCEIFSTAYAAWNDLLIWRKPVTDDAIVHEILNRWHDRKRQVPESRWRKALDWMRKEGYVPTGFGRPTAKCATEAA